MSDKRLLLLLAAACAAAACSSPGTVSLNLSASPSHGSLAGQFPVTITGYRGELGTLDPARDSVALGHYRLVQIKLTTASDGSVTISGMSQGDVTSGAADITITSGSQTGTASSAFTYDPPVAGVPQTWMAFGASLTQGVQSFGLTADSQRHGVAQVIAQQAGVGLALALFTETFLPGPTIADFNPDCSPMPGKVGLNFTGALKMLTDPTTGELSLAMARLDPTVVTRDVAIGGEKVADILNGPTDTNKSLFENMVEAPFTMGTSVFVAPAESQIDRIVALDPDVGFCTDLLFNDLDPSITQSDNLHPDLITPVATYKASLDQMLAKLGGLHGQYFLSNSPHFDVLPHVAALRAQLVPAKETACQFDALLAQIDSLIDQYDQVLATDSTPYKNIHIVDFASEAATFISSPPVIAGQTLTTKHFGGLFSLDDLHLTNTGYALYAQFIIHTMNSAMGWSIPDPDLVAVITADPYSPAALKADGFTCVP